MSIEKYQGTYIQGNFAERIGGSNYGIVENVYKFEKIKRAKQWAKQQFPHIQLIDLGVGEPDEMADERVVATLCAEAAKLENRGYADNGILQFKEAAALYLQKVFHVEGIDSITEVVHCIGAKSALAMLPSCFINPGDISIVTVPGYPVLGTHTRYTGGEVYSVPLTPEKNFLPDMDAIPTYIAHRAKLLYLNYPNNPTGACATPQFFAEVVKWAQRYHVIVVHDAPYAALTYKGTKPLSFLSIPGAKDVGIELHSLSKSYSMTGWRIGFAAGNPLVIKALSDMKDNTDSGQFIPIQKAAAYALAHPTITDQLVEKYCRRHDLLVGALQQLGFCAQKPSGSFFVYVPCPKGIVGGIRFATAEQFSQYLIREKLICSVPWDDVGPFVRFSVTFEAIGLEQEKQVIDEVTRRLSDVTFEF